MNPVGQVVVTLFPNGRVQIGANGLGQEQVEWLVMKAALLLMSPKPAEPEVRKIEVASADLLNRLPVGGPPVG